MLILFGVLCRKSLSISIITELFTAILTLCYTVNHADLFLHSPTLVTLVLLTLFLSLFILFLLTLPIIVFLFLNTLIPYFSGPFFLAAFLGLLFFVSFPFDSITFAIKFFCINFFTGVPRMTVIILAVSMVITSIAPRPD